MHIVRVWRSVAYQLAANIDGTSAKFKFKDVVPELKGYEKLSGAIDWLLAAGLIIKVPILQKSEQPLIAFCKENNITLFEFDVGILGALLGLSPETILQQDSWKV